MPRYGRPKPSDRESHVERAAILVHGSRLIDIDDRLSKGGCAPAGWRGDCPEIGGIMPPSPKTGVGGTPIQIAGQIQNRACRCRRQTGPAAASRHRVETTASAVTWPCA